MKKENKLEKVKHPWPTKAAMEQVYEMNLWGTNESPFYSGEGSHKPEIVDAYIDVVQSFFKSFKNPIIVCDLGCGDFNVGKQLFAQTKKYVAIDIVPNLIKRNTDTFEGGNLEFKCLDISVDDLPKGDCAIIRQVFQHLSNAEIHSILVKLYDFKHLIITEHLPQGDFEANKNIISGQGIRLKKQSGVDILKSPFNFKVKEGKQLLVTPLGEKKGCIVTMHYTL